MRVRVRSSKNDVWCASACETIIKVRVCVRHTVKFLATQRLIIGHFTAVIKHKELKIFSSLWIKYTAPTPIKRIEEEGK